MISGPYGSEVRSRGSAMATGLGIPVTAAQSLELCVDEGLAGPADQADGVLTVRPGQVAQ